MEETNETLGRSAGLRATDLQEARRIGADLEQYERDFLRAWDDLVAAWGVMTTPLPRREPEAPERGYPLNTTEHG